MSGMSGRPPGVGVEIMVGVPVGDVVLVTVGVLVLAGKVAVGETVITGVTVSGRDVPLSLGTQAVPNDKTAKTISILETT